MTICNLKHAAEYIAAQARKDGLMIEQVDPVVGEPGDSILLYAYHQRDSYSPIVIDLPMRIETDDALLIDEWRAAFMRALPADVKAPTAWP